MDRMSFALRWLEQQEFPGFKALQIIQPTVDLNTRSPWIRLWPNRPVFATHVLSVGLQECWRLAKTQAEKKRPVHSHSSASYWPQGATSPSCLPYLPCLPSPPLLYNTYQDVSQCIQLYSNIHNYMYIIYRKIIICISWVMKCHKGILKESYKISGWSAGSPSPNSPNKLLLPPGTECKVNFQHCEVWRHLLRTDRASSMARSGKSGAKRKLRCSSCPVWGLERFNKKIQELR